MNALGDGSLTLGVVQEVVIFVVILRITTTTRKYEGKGIRQNITIIRYIFSLSGVELGQNHQQLRWESIMSVMMQTY
jgi:hypothetical protein